MSNVDDLLAESLDSRFAYSEEDAKKLSGLECRTTQPTSLRPDCSFLRCQIGEIESRGIESIFCLKAFGESWAAALNALGARKSK